MSRDTSESHPGRPLGQFGRVKRVPGVGRCGRSEADRDPYLVLRGLWGAPYRLRRPTNGEASNAIHRTSPFTHSRKLNLRSYLILGNPHSSAQQQLYDQSKEDVLTPRHPDGHEP
jgi:hypothetical protein